MLCVLCIYAAVRSLICVDCSPVAEADSTQPAVFPVPPDCAHYLTALPLEGCTPPVTRRLALREGAVSSLSGQAEVFVWPDCTEIFLPVCPLPPQPSPAGLLCEGDCGRLHGVLFYECGTFFAVEQEGTTLLSLPLGTKKEGELFTADHCFVAISDSHCTVVSSDGPSVLFTLSGGSFSYANGEIVQTETLPTVRRHRRVRRYALDGALLDQNITPTFDPESGTDAFCALLEALSLGEAAEARSLLSGDLSEISTNDLREFFGTYTTVRRHPFRPDVAGTLNSEDFSVHAYSFEASEDAGSWRVENAEAL